MSQTSIPNAVRQLLFGVAAGRCEYLGCNKLLTRDNLNQPGKFSVFAHIIADKPDGPRGDAELSPQLAQDIDNLMLMCLDHHRLIDVYDVDGHTVDRLREMKARHEERIRQLTEIDDNHRTLLVRMAANIGDRKGIMSVMDARAAVLPMYAVDDGLSIDLAHLHVIDGDRVAWDVGMREIDATASQIQNRLVRENAQSLSIFALAPIPLLMYLGRMLGDIVPGEAYQRRREPPGWSWLPANGSEPPFDVVVVEPMRRSSNVCLVFSVSDAVDVDALGAVIPDAPRYVIRVPEPKTDLVRTREQLDAFRKSVRGLLPLIRNQHGANVIVHVFPALPNSLAVEFGRVLLPKSDPHMKVYDLNRASGGWSYALTLLPPVLTG
ncbi:MAG: SAVED domain-containing protein [Polyangiaceae bacterium]|nr:SAVED domain-containing protein [Polyangiaceae bacterium]